MILEIVSREAFRLARELFHIRLTNTQTDRQTDTLKDWSPVLKPHLPFGLLSSFIPHPSLSSLHPSQPSSSTSSSHYPEARLWTVFMHAHTHDTNIGTPETTSQARSFLPSQSHCWRNQAKGVIDQTDWIQCCTEREVRLRISLLSHATSVTPVMTSSWPETFKLRLRLSAISSVWCWQIPGGFSATKKKRFLGVGKFGKENKHGNVLACRHFCFCVRMLETERDKERKTYSYQYWHDLRVQTEAQRRLQKSVFCLCLLRYDSKGQTVFI